MANGVLADLSEAVVREVEFYWRRRRLKMHLFPDLTVPALLGMDFLHHFSLIISFNAREWCFENELSKTYPFSGENKEDLCYGISDLTPRLKIFLRQTFSGPIGLTTLTSHHLEVGEHLPIRQQSYTVSPKGNTRGNTRRGKPHTAEEHN